MPYVGVKPATPQKLAGQEMLPPVLSAIAICGYSKAFARPAAPPELPPQLLSGSVGFFGAPNPEFVENVPNPN